MTQDLWDFKTGQAAVASQKSLDKVTVLTVLALLIGASGLILAFVKLFA